VKKNDLHAQGHREEGEIVKGGFAMQIKLSRLFLKDMTSKDEYIAHLEAQLHSFKRQTPNDFERSKNSQYETSGCAVA